MTTQNNAYLCNFLLSSVFMEYNNQYCPILGLDASIPFYLFNYSRELFLSYPEKFCNYSIVADSPLHMNICYALLHHIQPINNLKYSKNGITFTYVDRFPVSIYTADMDSKYGDLYVNNPYDVVTYKGFFFNIPPIDCSIAYCIDQYATHNQNFTYLMHLIVLSSVYKRRLLYNNVLINLLRLNINLKNIFNKIKKDIKKITSMDIPHCPLTYNVMQDRTLELLEFCHG
jgi:hypothetical protein